MKHGAMTHGILGGPGSYWNQFRNAGSDGQVRLIRAGKRPGRPARFARVSARPASYNAARTCPTVVSAHHARPANPHLERPAWMRYLPVTFPLLVVLTAAAESSVACTCDPRGQTVKAALDSATAVFAGRVLSVDAETDGEGEHRVYYGGGKYVLQVTEAWKGIDTLTDAVTLRNRSNCGYRFKKDHVYLVYAYGRQRLRASVCGRTTPLSGATADFEQLGAPIYRRTPQTVAAIKSFDDIVELQEHAGRISISVVIVVLVTASFVTLIAVGCRRWMPHASSGHHRSSEVDLSPDTGRPGI